MNVHANPAISAGLLTADNVEGRSKFNFNSFFFFSHSLSAPHLELDAFKSWSGTFINFKIKLLTPFYGADAKPTHLIYSWLKDKLYKG